jgi:hypothetical protein
MLRLAACLCALARLACVGGASPQRAVEHILKRDALHHAPRTLLGDVTPETLARAALVVPGQARRTVVACFTNYDAHTAQAKLTLSWLRLAKERRLPVVLGVCNAEAVRMDDVAQLLAERWGELFAGTVRQCVINPRIGRAYYAKIFAEWGYDTLYTDPDVALLRDVAPYLGALYAKHPEVDVLAMSDSNTGVYGEHSVVADTAPATPGKTAWHAAFPDAPVPQGFVRKPEHAWRDSRADQLLALLGPRGGHNLGLEWPGNCEPFQFNTGVLVVRATQRSMALLKLWMRVLDTTLHNPTADDQLAFNDVLKNQSTYCAKVHPTNRTLACGDDPDLNVVADNTACFGLLNLPQFANGFVYAGSRAHEQYGVAPFAFHATYSSDKAMKLKEEGLFRESPAYYSDVKLLVYDNQLAMNMLHPRHEFEDAPIGYYTWERHFYFVQHQLRQLRAALAISYTLNRTLVLPRVAFICQCFFFPGKNCVIDGHRVRLPHVAPSDHWLKPGVLQLSHRESGFLQATDANGVNLVPARVRASRLRVEVPRPMTDGELRHLLAPHDHVRVLHIPSVLEAFGGFQDAAVDAAFEQAMGDMLGSWCCLLGSEHPDGPVPGVEVLRVRYTWDGAPSLVDGQARELGRCGA